MDFISKGSPISNSSTKAKKNNFKIPQHMKDRLISKSDMARIWSKLAPVSWQCHVQLKMVAQDDPPLVRLKWVDSDYIRINGSRKALIGSNFWDQLQRQGLLLMASVDAGREIRGWFGELGRHSGYVNFWWPRWCQEGQDLLVAMRMKKCEISINKLGDDDQCFK